MGLHGHRVDGALRSTTGLVLGPLLFLVYVNDMPAAVTSKMTLYADGSTLLVSGKGTSYTGYP